MWIVRIALTRPYTFIVLALLLLIIGPIAIWRMPTDIFPDINIPVVSVVWNFIGLPPDEMADRITSIFERAVTTTVNDIEHIESDSMVGVSVIKLFFQPSVKIEVALSQVTAISQTLLKSLPPGATPPLILSYNASSVPIIQLVLSSQTLSEQKLYDYANNFIRTQLATVQGASIPFPYGGKQRQVVVDLNQAAMQAYRVSPQEVNAAIGAQNLILPAGTQKIGTFEYIVKLNASPLVADELNEMPIRSLNGGVLFVRDVAHVRDGFIPQTNIVNFNGTRAVMMTILKTGNASTLNIVNRIKDRLPIIKDTLPPELNITTFADQSIFVTAAIRSVLIEAVIAASLTGIMILLFLGSLRSTFIITVSIPLSMIASIIALAFLGETINIMTLGGLALAVGILVDDATVAIENINWNLEQGKEIEEAIMDGAAQIAVPAFVSTLAICIVFIPMFFLGGVAKFLFVPFAEAVVFAMLASYVLSRTLVATLAKYLLHKRNHSSAKNNKENFFLGIHHKFENNFERMRGHYHKSLTTVLDNKGLFIIAFLSFIGLSILLLGPFLGADFFPAVDAGQIKLHLRAPTGTRIEETAKLSDQVNTKIRRIIPAKEIKSIVDNIGLPASGINLSYSNSGTVGPEDADILIALKEKHHATADYIRKLRLVLPRSFPGVTFAFLPADIVNQILNFGLPAPIDLQVIGMQEEANLRYAAYLLERIRHVPGVVDARLRQSYNYPELFVKVNRSLAKEFGYTQADVVSNVLISLSGSFQTTPTFWLNPKNGVSYPITTLTPQYTMTSLQDLRNIPITPSNFMGQQQILGAMATIKRISGPIVESHYNVQPKIDVFASVQDRDLGSVATAINRILAETAKKVPKGSIVVARGQMRTQRQSFFGLYAGLAFSIVIVYLLIVINFQSWVDPFIIITALPAAIAGIAWILFLTHTTLSVPALTGAIMCMGVATANSILMVSFARQNIKEGKDVITAALDAAVTRIRPVLMTASAMILGMLPMAIGLGEGSEQNAPLGRAVIGGLLFATMATLFFVPAVFCFIHGRNSIVKEKVREQ